MQSSRIELEDVKFDVHSNQLSGISRGIAGSKHSLYIYVPEGYNWNPAPGKLFRNFGEYAVKFTDNQILRIDLDFDDKEKVNWLVEFSK